jgi:hypothetical protein
MEQKQFSFGLDFYVFIFLAGMLIAAFIPGAPMLARKDWYPVRQWAVKPKRSGKLSYPGDEPHLKFLHPYLVFSREKLKHAFADRNLSKWDAGHQAQQKRT